MIQIVLCQCDFKLMSSLTEILLFSLRDPSHFSNLSSYSTQLILKFVVWQFYYKVESGSGFCELRINIFQIILFAVCFLYTLNFVKEKEPNIMILISWLQTEIIIFYSWIIVDMINKIPSKILNSKSSDSLNSWYFCIVSGAEIFSPFVGDSEKAIVELFR